MLTIATYRMTKAEWAEVREWFSETHYQDAPDLGDDTILVTMSGHAGAHHNLQQKLGRNPLTAQSTEMVGRERTHPLVRV